jgi:NADH dehydrogenase
VRVDVRDPAAVDSALDGALAAVNLVGVLYERGRQGFEALHAEAVDTIARACAARGIERFVQVSAIGADPASPALYARSKAAGEAAARAHVPGAVILRPSIVFGPEDDFFNRFAGLATLAPALPLIGGGGTRFQPVYAGDVGAAVAAALADPVSAGRTYELGGPGVYTFKALLQLMLKETHKARLLLPLPFPAAWLIAKAGDLQAKLLPFPPTLTTDQLAMLKTDNVVAPGAAGLEALGIAPTALEAVLPTYLWRFRKGGQFAPPTPVGGQSE